MCVQSTSPAPRPWQSRRRREDYFSSLCPVNYDERASCPAWQAFILQVFDNNENLVGFIQRLLGYCLTGDVQEQILPICWGIGANGKSTLINTFLSILGNNYAGKASRDLLMAAKGDRHPTQLAQLFRKRFVCAVESHQGAKLDEGLVKEMTGGDPITARRMKEDYWTFLPTHKLCLVTNHPPVIDGTDHGIWRRLRLIPFTVVFEGAKQDKSLPGKLLAESSGILRRCIDGCRAWQRDGLGEPGEVLAATAQYRSEQDTLGDWIAACCVTGSPDYRQRFSDLFDSFKRWASVQGDRGNSLRRLEIGSSKIPRVTDFGSTASPSGRTERRNDF
jgi:putative DNA primase/helicase